DRHAVPDRGNGLVEPRRAIDNEELWPPQSARDEIVRTVRAKLGHVQSPSIRYKPYCCRQAKKTKDFYRSSISYDKIAQRVPRACPWYRKRDVGNKISGSCKSDLDWVRP